jgi:hypothetical protein
MSHLQRFQKVDTVGKLLHRTQIERVFVVLPGRNGGFANDILMRSYPSGKARML